MKLRPPDKIVVNLTLIGSLCFSIMSANQAIANSGSNITCDTHRIERNSLEQLRNRAVSGDASAQFSLAKLYLEGWKAEQDIKNAVQLIKSSARLGNVDAQYTLGVMYASGDCVKFNPSKAVEWLERAANQGSNEASFFLTTIINSEIDIGC